jgi:hypothetical protein
MAIHTNPDGFVVVFIVCIIEFDGKSTKEMGRVELLCGDTS